MTNISQIDPNFKVETALNQPNIRFHNPLTPPFQIHGVFYEDGMFRRLPASVAQSVSEGVYVLHTHTAGGRIRFKTNSTYVAIHAQMPGIGKMSHFALCGSAGFDLYVQNQFYGSFLPPFDIQNGYESIIYLPSAEMREITINLPLYSSVSTLFVGLEEGAEVDAPTPYAITTPIVYYGSSITQGGCASRPGTAYQSFIERSLSADYINLGFSGNAKAESEISAYIQSLSMSAFIYDYDHNAPTVQHLKDTHERMFLEIRQKHPTLPIILLSRPKAHYTPDEEERLGIIKATYEHALARGDQNVYLIDGRTLMQLAGDDGTVDSCHPTDLGFFSMAQALIPCLEKIFTPNT